MQRVELRDISSIINLKLFFEEKHIFELYVRWFGVQIKILYAFLSFPRAYYMSVLFHSSYHRDVN